MRRVLMVCYYFPPLGGIGSLRALKFARYLPEAGWQPTVLAPRAGSYFRDPSLEFPEESVVRTRSLELSRLAKRVVAPATPETEPAQVGRALGWMRRLAHWALYRPDGQVGWRPFAVAAGRRLLREARFDAVYSTSFPITAHVVARRLHRDFGLPWVAEFRDPWTDVASADPPRPGDMRLEGEIVKEASAVVLPSPDWAEMFRRKGATRVEVITNGWDPADLETSVEVSGRVLTHLGSFYPDRQDLGVVWRALGELRRDGRLEGLRLRFVGELHPMILAEIRSQALEELVETTGFVSHREALRWMGASTALLVAGPRDSRIELRGLIPAKVFEYLGSGLPIVYAGDTSGDLAQMLRHQPACHLVAPGDVAAARTAVTEAMATPRVQRSLPGLTRRELAARLGVTLDWVCER